MWFSKKKQDNPETMKAMLDIIQKLHLRVSSLEIELDSIKTRIKKRMIPKETEELPKEETGINDGFDSLRNI